MRGDCPTCPRAGVELVGCRGARVCRTCEARVRRDRAPRGSEAHRAKLAASWVGRDRYWTAEHRARVKATRALHRLLGWTREARP